MAKILGVTEEVHTLRICFCSTYDSRLNSLKINCILIAKMRNYDEYFCRTSFSNILKDLVNVGVFLGRINFFLNASPLGNNFVFSRSRIKLDHVRCNLHKVLSFFLWKRIQNSQLYWMLQSWQIISLDAKNIALFQCYLDCFLNRELV